MQNLLTEKFCIRQGNNYNIRFEMFKSNTVLKQKIKVVLKIPYLILCKYLPNFFIGCDTRSIFNQITAALNVVSSTGCFI